MGNTISPVEDPIKRAVQADPVESTISFQEYQNAMEQGIPITTAVTNGLFAHQEDIYWAFNWNHPITCATATKKIPIYIFISVVPNL